MDALPIARAPRPLGHERRCASFPIAYGCWRFAGTDVRDGAREDRSGARARHQPLRSRRHLRRRRRAREDALRPRARARRRACATRMLIATKGGIVPGVPYDSSARAHPCAPCEASLQRLRIDVIDLYQIHRPDLLGASRTRSPTALGAAARERQDPRGRRVELHARRSSTRCSATCPSRSPRTSPSSAPGASTRCATACSISACATA